ncbi:hypothetical protein C162_28434 [Paenibacillus sp. FSL R7-269]|uniref:hypothetical protein n=1 Tax=Paenibacillus sp. FSL R7-269 TaxID=1226755 RepID=UPI0003E2BB6C|nr:hypothetical protein [Paenibacillus sp. FSL R7-269]ETT39044.1 hypothetical protein C162_28434 [Paenibacillus sp. FSL R7-269]
MPDPLSPTAAAAAGFNHYTRQYSSPVYALSCLLLEKGARAEQATTATFVALHPLWLKSSLSGDSAAAAAYRECIRQCAVLARDHSRCAATLLNWDDHVASALWYGIQLPLPDISQILDCSILELKARLRGIREQMAAAHSALPAVHRPSAG